MDAPQLTDGNSSFKLMVQRPLSHPRTDGEAEQGANAHNWVFGLWAMHALSFYGLMDRSEWQSCHVHRVAVADEQQCDVALKPTLWIWIRSCVNVSVGRRRSPTPVTETPPSRHSWEDHLRSKSCRPRGTWKLVLNCLPNCNHRVEDVWQRHHRVTSEACSCKCSHVPYTIRKRVAGND